MRPLVNFDLHCHSSVSDGLLPPAEVVRWAVEIGTDCLSLTDHDSLGGLSEAAQAAKEARLAFIPGVEVSGQWQETPVHIVGLGFDPENLPLQNALEHLRSGRIERARRMGEAFEAIGIPGVFEGAKRYALTPDLISRAHFARYLVEQKLFQNTRDVFARYLSPGKPGYVKHRWASLEDAVAWIHGAGGRAVVAHPGRYKISSGDMRRFLGDFKDMGGAAIEVLCASHSPEQARHFSSLARQFDLYVSRGSDFHGKEESYAHTAYMEPLPDHLTPVWRLLGF